jgi:opacity protein-like surface antigen
MRRILLTLTLLVALALPAASAAQVRTPNDGTLSVRDARGTITLQGRGAVIGSIVRGTVTINDPVDGDGTGPIVKGDEWSKERSETTTTWGQKDVRFRIIGGTFKIVVKGRGINLSMVGKGNVTLKGLGTDDDGSYSVNGQGYSLIPPFSFPFPLSSTSP